MTAVFPIDCLSQSVAVVELQTATDTIGYADFAKALKAANKKEQPTLKLLTDVDFPNGAPSHTVSTNLTLDLNGYSFGGRLKSTRLFYLNTDTLTLRIISSRDTGYIRAVADTATRVTALNIAKGALDIQNVVLDVSNGSETVLDKMKQSAVAISVAARTALYMENCQVRVRSSYGATAVSGAGNQGSAARIDIHSVGLSASAATNSYGVNAYSRLQMDDTEVSATSVGSTAYGVYINTYTDTTTQIAAVAHLTNLALSASANLKAHGVYANADVKMSSMKATVAADSITAYGVYIVAGKAVSLSDCDIQVKGLKTVFGINALGSKTAAASLRLTHVNVSVEGDESVTAVGAYPDLQASQVTVTATASRTTAYGLNMTNYTDNDYTERPSCRLTDWTITVSAGDKAYGVSSKGIVSADSIEVEAEASGMTACAWMAYHDTRLSDSRLYARSGSKDAQAFNVGNATGVVPMVECVNTVFDAQTGGIQSYAANVTKGDMRASYCSFTATARQDTATVVATANCMAVNMTSLQSLKLHRCSLTATASNDSCARYVYALNSAGTCVVDSCTMRVLSAYVNSYGVYLAATGSGALTDCDVSVVGTKTVYGINALGSKTAAASLRLTRVNVLAEGDESVTAVGSYPDLLASQVTAKATAHRTTAYGLNMTNYTDIDYTERPSCRLTDWTITVSAGDKAYGVSSKGIVSADSIEVAAEASGVTACAWMAYHDTRLSDCRLSARSGSKDAQAFNVAKLGNVEAHQCTLTAVISNEMEGQYAYALYQSGIAALDSCTLYAESAFEHAYALYLHSSSQQTVLNECRLSAHASDNEAVIRKNAATIGTMWLENGYFSDNTNLQDYVDREWYGIYELPETEEAYEQGYAYTIRPKNNPRLPVCSVYDDYYRCVARCNRLEEAFDYVNARSAEKQTIVLTADYMLSAGHYVVPAATTMIIPYAYGQTAPIGTVALRTTVRDSRAAYVSLSLAEGAEISVAGMLELSAEQKAGGVPTGQVYGPYGFMQMHAGSRIILENGAVLTAWGYIIGDGTVEVKKGASVYENLQIGDWKGFAVMTELVNNPQRVFPISHYFYQNIEATVLYHYGATGYASTSEGAGEFILNCDNIAFVGQRNAFFNFDDTADPVETWVRKDYDPLTDRVTYTLHGKVNIEELDIVGQVPYLGEFAIKSSKYILPLAQNLNIVLEDGEFVLTHDMEMLPSSVLTVDTGAVLVIPENVSLTLFAPSEWLGYNGKRMAKLAYSPSWKKCPRDTALVSAQLQVGGTVIAHGRLHVTSDEVEVCPLMDDEGRICFGTPADSVVRNEPMTIYQMTGTPSEYRFEPVQTTAAVLRNADLTLTRTANARTGDVYTYTEGRWSRETQPTALAEACGHAVVQPRKVFLGGTLLILMPDGCLYDTSGRRLMTALNF